MGLLYTKFYIDFGPEMWRQASTDPLVFEAVSDAASLEIEDVSHVQHNVRFKKGAKLVVRRIAGRYRISWDDSGA